ncbi:MAG: extracellular solute-binding protein [Acholeplasmataceae bacterium]
MKKTILMLLIIVTTFLLVSCVNNEAGDRIQIDFWHMSPVGSESYSGMKAIINDFNDSQDVYYVKGTGFSFWDYWDKISVAISSRTAPDIGLSTIDDVEARASQGVLYNISDLMTTDETNLNNIDINQFRESQLKFARYDNDLYALPFTATTRALYVNLDMFAEKGLTADDIPTTWSELKTVAKMFDETNNDGDIVRLGFDPTYGNASFPGWLWETGLDFFDENLDPTLNTQAYVDVLNWVINFNSEYSRSKLTSFGEANALLGVNVFAAEKVAMIVDVDELYHTLENSNVDFDFDVAMIPIPDENGVHVNWGSGFSIEMYDNGKNEDDQKQGTYEFLKYLMSYDTQLELADVTGWIMGHIDAMNTYAEDKPILQKLLTEVNYAVDKVYVPYAPSWHGTDWTTYYTQALNGDLTAAQALAAARDNYLQKKENWERTNS